MKTHLRITFSIRLISTRKNGSQTGDTALYQTMLRGEAGSRPDGNRPDDRQPGSAAPFDAWCFRMVALLDGETVVDLKPVFGYLHRNHEKIGERNTWLQNMPFTDRLDYVSSMSNNFGYALAVEQLMGSSRRSGLSISA
jgi:hypothetical protein